MSVNAMNQDLKIDARIAFDDFSLDVSHHSRLDGITGLFGPSGCGKSTMLRIIAGLERKAHGQVTFDGETWLDTTRNHFVEPHLRGVGYVFQEARLFPHLTVLGNLRFSEKRSRHLGTAIKLDDVIDALDLSELLSRTTTSLSGGERQRVAIARTLLTRPRLLLMDEPLSALDFRRKAAIIPYIERLPDLFEIPIIYVTHAIDEVARLVDRLLVLEDGRKMAEGPVHDVLERLDLQSSTGRFEAGVVLEAIVSAHDETFNLTHLTCCGQTITMPELDIPVGLPVRLRIRARDVALATSRPAGLSIRNVLEGIIAEIVEEPNTAFAETRVDIGGAGLRARITRASVADLGLKEGGPVFALVKSISFDRRGL